MDTKLPPGSLHTGKPFWRTLVHMGVIVIGALCLWLVGLGPFRSEVPQPQAPSPETSEPAVALTTPAAVLVPPSPTLAAAAVSLSDRSLLTPAVPLESGLPEGGSASEPPGEALDPSSEPAQEAAVSAPLVASSPTPEGTGAPEEPSSPPEPCTDGASGTASACVADDASQGDTAQAPGQFGGGALPGPQPEPSPDPNSGPQPLDVSEGEAVGEAAPFDSPRDPSQVGEVPGGRTPHIVTPFDSPLMQPPADTELAAAPATQGNWVWPVRGVISQGYSSAHRAIDVDTAQGSVVGAADAGRVVYAEWETSGYGYLVIVDHDNGYVSYYAHLYGFYVDVGQTVARGQQIGELGNTGDSTGPHLHFEIRYGGVQHDPLGLLPES